MFLLKWLNENIEKYICIILFSAIVIIMLVNIVMRFVFQNAIPWASDLILFIFVWFVWFAISFGFKESAHVTVGLIPNLLSEKGKIILSLISNSIAIVGFTFLFTVGVQILTHSSIAGITGLLIEYPMCLDETIAGF